MDKLRKILSLANGMNATQGEIENAMAKAKELAMRHSIDLADVDLDEGQGPAPIEIEVDKETTTRSEYQQPYHSPVLHILKKVFGVHAIRNITSCYGGTRVNHITLVGDPFDVAIAKVIFPWLEKLFPKSLSALVRRGQLTYCAADTNGYYNGLCHGIIKANAKEEAKLNPADSETWALVVRNKETAIAARVEEEFPNLKKGDGRKREFNHGAAAMGFIHGKRINLSQVGRGTEKSQIG